MPAEGTNEQWLSRNLKVLSGVSFLQDTASEMLYPILPTFLTVTLGAPAAVVGIIEGLANGLASMTTVVSGSIADRARRRPMIAIGYSMAAVGKVLIALAYTWPVVLVGRLVDRLGKGVRGAPRDALLVVDVPEGSRGRAFGFHRAADTAGAVVGPLIGLLLYELLGHNIRPLLWVAVIPAVLSVFLVAFLRERRAPAPPEHARVHGPARLPASYWRTAAVLVLFALVNFPDALLLLRLTDIGFSTSAVILAYVGYNAVYALVSYPAGALSDRWSRRRTFGVGLVFFALGYLGLGLTHDKVVAAVLLAAYGTFTAATDGVGKAWVSSLAGPGEQGTAQGWFQGLWGGGILMAGVWAGLLWGADGTLPLLLSGSVGAVLAVWLLLSGGSHAPAAATAEPGGQ